MSIKKNTLWNLLGSVAPMLVGVLAVPYIYKQIGIERTGVLTLIWALIGYFSIFDFGLGRAVTQRIASLRFDEAKQRAMSATTGVSLTLLIGIVGGFLGYAIMKLVGFGWINSTQELDQEIYSSFLMTCIAIPATTVTTGLRGILEGEQRFKDVNLLKAILGFSNFLAPVFVISLLGNRLDFIVGSLVFARYVILTAHYLSVKNIITNIQDNLSLEESKLLFRFGGWVTLSNILSPLMVVADRFLIANVLGVAVVAYYTIPAEFMIRLLILPAAITTTLFPVFSKSLAKNDLNAIALYKKSLKIIFLMMGAITITIIVGVSYVFEIWLGHEFSEKSSVVASILAIGIFFNSLAQIPMAYIQASGDARSTALVHILEFIVYIPILFLMMRLFGLNGVAVAWALRAFFDLALLLNLVRRLKE